MDNVFTIEWLTTIPGILITIGIVLLIIALILFFIGSNSEKKKNDGLDFSSDESNYGDKLTSVPKMDTVVQPVMGVNNNISTPTPVSISDNPFENTSGNSYRSISPVDIKPVEIVDNEVKPIDNISNSIPVVDSIPSVFNPIEIKPDVQEIEVVPEVLDKQDIKPIEIPTIQDDATVINPIYDNTVSPIEEIKVEDISTPVDVSSNSRTIYGGANPLDATQNLPKVDVHHVPYSGGMVDQSTTLNYVSDLSTEVSGDIESL